MMRTRTFVGWCAGVILLLGGCASGPGWQPAPDGPPAVTPAHLAHLPDPVPTDEPPSKRGNPASYEVLGKTYFVMSSADGYREDGQASWYGTKFHGRLTSSGEPFDMYQLTAAHRSLPIPAYVRVTNLANGRKTIVRVNDRGPFHPNRIIDLSYAAAVKLGFHQSGTAPVRVEVVRPQPPPQNFMLQAGAFSTIEGADALKLKIASLVDVASYVVRTTTDHLYRVRLGPIAGEPEVQRIQSLLEANNLGRPLLIPSGSVQ